MWLLFWSDNVQAGDALWASVAAGVCFGLGMAAYYSYGQWKYALPSWERLGND